MSKEMAGKKTRSIPNGKGFTNYRRVKYGHRFRISRGKTRN